ncbi:MAG: hypothetical protein A2W22_06930 [Candidatus Levybacteria bacterium RBG_16_35_11]|nr:MAG: hypothetical protein A2W22_06930 [Candidatus Levybacteria bacterium RBG_16_35_11]
MKKNKERMEFTQDIKKRFEILRNKVGDYKPEVFDSLEKKFLELCTHRVFRQLVNKDLRENKCPATEWLKANEYPVTEAEKIVLRLFNTLTKDSAKQFFHLIHNYLFKLKNSMVFQGKCRRMDKTGFNSIEIFLEKNKFSPVYKDSV